MSSDILSINWYRCLICSRMIRCTHSIHLHIYDSQDYLRCSLLSIGKEDQFLESVMFSKKDQKSSLIVPPRQLFDWYTIYLGRYLNIRFQSQYSIRFLKKYPKTKFNCRVNKEPELSSCTLPKESYIERLCDSKTYVLEIAKIFMLHISKTTGLVSIISDYSYRNSRKTLPGF